MTKANGWQSFAFLLAVVLGGLLSLDFLLAPESDTAQPAIADAGDMALPNHGAKHRMLVLLVDSLRYQTATSPRVMPRFVALQRTATIAKVVTTRDAVTVPALRAAFTGRDRTALFGFVENFVKNEAGIESIFNDAHRAGLRAVAYSEGAFNQFGHDVELQSNLGKGSNVVDAQNDALKRAFKDYRTGRHDVVIAHITYSDQVAHGGGIGTDSYRAFYQVIDEIIEKLAALVPADETFVVMGDHGHDETGRHALGLDVPTFAFYRGSAFCTGCDLGTMSITDHRYLMGWALGLPLPDDYRGGRHPEALAPGAEVPRAYVQAAVRTRPPDAQGLPASRRLAAFMMLLYLGALAFLGMLALLGAPAWSWRVALALFVPAVPLAFPFWLPWNAVVGVAGTVAAMASVPLSLERKKLARWLVGAMALTMALCIWGHLEARFRASFHEPAFWKIGIFWAAIAGCVVLIARRARDPRVAWIVLGAPLVLFYPTVYRYGAPGAMAPAWMGWILATLSRAVSRLRKDALLVGAALFLMLVPFKAEEAENFAFTTWISWPIFSPLGWTVLALVAKLVIFVRRGAGAVATALALSMVTVLLVLEQGWGPPRGWQLGLALLCAAAPLSRVFAMSAAFGRSPSGRAAFRTLSMGALLIAYHATVQVPGPAYAWLDCFLAAIVLSVWLARANLSEEWLPDTRAGLTLLAVFAAGWVTLAWTVHWLEWGFLYDWFEVAFVERHVGYFIPIIVLRYAIPVVAARILLAETLSVAGPYPRRAVWLLAGGKAVSLLLLTCGIGFHSADSEVYLEAAQETGIFALLCAGLI